MVVLWIILGILLFIILAVYILLHISVRADIDANLQRIKINVTYLGLKLWNLDSSEKTKDDTKKSSSAEKQPEKPDIELVELTDEAQNSDNIDDSSSDKSTDGKSDGKEPFFDKAKRMIEEYKPFVPVANKGLRKLFKMIRLYDLDFTVTVGDSDAYEAAMKFGKVNALVYSILGLLCCAFSVTIKSTAVNCDFNSKKTEGTLKTTVKIKPSAFVSLVIYLGGNYLLIKRKQKKKHTNEQSNLKKESNNNEREEQQP